MNNMEEQLWEYIDGTCTEKQRATIATLIEQDKKWNEAFNQILEFDKDIAAIMPDEPSMGFSYKVMENIRSQAASTPLKTRTNPYLITAIAGFFLITLTALMVMLLGNSTQLVGNVSLDVNYHTPGTSLLTDSGTLKIFFYVDILLLLLFVDTLIRRKINNTVA